MGASAATALWNNAARDAANPGPEPAADPAAPLPQSHGYWISVLGRFVFGFSYESLITANQGLLSDWFGVRPAPPRPRPARPS